VASPQRAVTQTITTIFGIIVVIVCLTVAYAVARGVQPQPDVIVNDQEDCVARTLTPAQLSTDRWWEQCD
jgi:hypothetical protein